MKAHLAIEIGHINQIGQIYGLVESALLYVQVGEFFLSNFSPVVFFGGKCKKLSNLVIVDFPMTAISVTFFNSGIKRYFDEFSPRVSCSWAAQTQDTSLTQRKHWTDAFGII